MIAYPAIDLRGGRVVQLVGGDPAQQRVSLPDPRAVAQQWEACGFRALHVVDLDAALGLGGNHVAITDVLAATTLPVQVGGGIRSEGDVERLLTAGAARVIVGTRAVLEPDWLASLAAAYPGRIVLAADCRGDAVLVRGWTETAPLTLTALLERCTGLPLAAILITDVAREGRLEGADTERFAALARSSPSPLLASGGITTPADLCALAAAGVAGAVLGMALYTGALEPRAVAQEHAG